MDKFIRFKFVKSIEENSQGWSVKILSIAFTLTFFSAMAQETPDKPVTATPVTAVSSDAATATEASKSSRNSTEVAGLEAKINVLLKEVRLHLSVEGSRVRFRENHESAISNKAALACPNVGLINLIYGSEPFVATPEMDSQQLYYAIEFLNVSINTLIAN